MALPMLSGDLARREFEAARKLLDAERAVLDKLLAHDPSYRDWRFTLARHHEARASLLAEQGQHSRAVEHARRAVDTLQELVSAAPEQRNFATWLALAWWRLGRVQQRVGAPAEAHAAWQRGLELSEALARQGSEPSLRDARARLLLALERVDDAKLELSQLARMGYREPTLAEVCREHGVALAP